MEMIDTPRGPRSLLFRISKFASIPLTAVVVVVLLSPLGEGNANAPEFTTTLEFIAPKSAPVPVVSPAPQDQRPPAVGGQQQPPPVIRDPAVLAILESNPKTPADRVQAIVTLLDLKAPLSAATLLDELVEEQLDDDTIYELGKKFGSTAFLKIGRAPELQPRGMEFARHVMTTTERVARDPARLEAVAANLASSDEIERLKTIAELRHGGQQSAAVLIKMLANDDRAAASGTAGDDVVETEVLQQALVGLRGDSIAPLCGAMSCPKPRVRIAAAATLTELRSADAVPFLLAGTASAEESVRQASLQALSRLTGEELAPQKTAQYLYAETKALYLGDPVWAGNRSSEVRLWNWSTEEQTVVAQQLTQQQASAVAAATLAAALHRMLPDSEPATNLYVNATLQSMAALQGADHAPFPANEGSIADLAGLGPARLNAALAEALAEHRDLAARAAVDLLAEMNDPRLLFAAGTEVSPLAAACSHANPRVRFAAAKAIMRLQPTQSFRGASFVTPTLGHFAATRGKPRVMIADTRTVDAQQLAGLAMMLGFRADTANTSRSLIEQALNSPDYQFILLDITLPNADIDLVVQQLRKDPRTGALPIGFLAPIERQKDAENYARRYGSSIAFVRPVNEEILAEELRKLAAAAATPLLSDDERMQYAAESLRLLAELASGEPTLFSPLPEAVAAQSALYVMDIAAPAIEFQASCRLPEAQTALVDFASTGNLPSDLRRQAAEGFARSLNRHGILLTSSQVLRQYDRYNASATSDDATIAILSSILDAIEAAAEARNGRGN